MFAARVTLPWNPLKLVSVMVDVAFFPGAIVRSNGFRLAHSDGEVYLMPEDSADSSYCDKVVS